MSAGYEYGYGGGGGGGDSYSGMDAMTGSYGGGFMDDAGASGNKVVEKKASRDSQTLFPVSIKQLNNASMEDDQNKIDGAELHTVIIMGIVESVEEHSTNVNFRVNDGTGAVEGKLWNDKDSSGGGLASKIANCRENSFVKVVGQLREYEGRKHILIYDITPIVDWNELSHHLLQIIFIHLQNTRGPIPGTGNMAKQSTGQSSQFSSNNGGGNNFQNNSNQHQNMGNQFQNQNQNHNQNQHQNGRGAVKDEHQSLKGMIKNVFDTGNFNRSTGLNIRQIVQNLQQNGMPNINEGAIRNVCSEMTDDGVIYSTIDEDHFLAT